MTIKEFFESDEYIAIHCGSEEDAIRLLSAFDKFGYKWSNGDRYIEDTNWGDCEEETCYSNGGKFADKTSYQDHGCMIIEFEDIEIQEMSNMTIKEFFESKEDLAIHCDTEEKAKALLNAFDKAGYKWLGGLRYIEITNWEEYSEETCYSNFHLYCYKEWYQRRNYAILEFEDIEI